MKQIRISLMHLVCVLLYSSSLTAKHFSFDMIGEQDNFIPAVVIGSGPGGLTAAYYIARGKMPVTLFAGVNPGGQLMGTSEVENWPGIRKAMGSEIIDTLFEQARDFGAAIKYEDIVSVDFEQWPYTLKTSENQTVRTLAVIIATGASARKLGIEGELEYWGHGVSICAICDARAYKNEKVVVIGGGDSAVTEALQLAPYASEVTILVRSARMRAVRSMQDKLSEYPNIKVIYNKNVTKIVGDGKKVTGVDLLDSETQQKSHMPIAGVFLAIGHNPTTEIFSTQLKLNKEGYIVVEAGSQQTSIEGVFAVGDVCDSKYKQAIGAAGRGMEAALDTAAFLRDIGFSDVVARRFERNYFGYEQRFQ